MAGRCQNALRWDPLCMRWWVPLLVLPVWDQSPAPFSGATCPQEKVEARRQRITAEFQKVNLLLAEQQQQLLRVLQQEEEEMTARLQGTKEALEQQGEALETLLLHLEDQEGQAPLQMLQVGAQLLQFN